MSTAPDFSELPLEVQERLALREAQYTAAYERGAANERLQQALTAVGGSARSLLGEVTATVSASGLLTDLRIGQKGLALGAAGLSRLIKQTIREALVNLEENLAEAVETADAGEIGAATLAEARLGLATPLRALDAPDPDDDLRVS